MENTQIESFLLNDKYHYDTVCIKIAALKIAEFQTGSKLFAFELDTTLH